MKRLPPASERLLFKVPEVAELLDRPVGSVWKAISKGDIESVRIAGVVRVHRNTVAKLMRGKK